MNKVLKEKLMQAFSSVLPVTVIVLVISVIFVPELSVAAVMIFLLGAAFLIVGMGFFTLGVDMAMRPMGEGIGVQLTKSSKLILVILVSFAMGIMITIAEPDLQVLAKQVPFIPTLKLILTVAAGVGVLLVTAVLRSLFRIKLSILLIIIYAIIFGLSFFANGRFIPVAFESGAIATGPIAVPFILAMGLGLAALRSDKDSLDDSFGMVALALTGPIIAMLILGTFYEPSEIKVDTAPIGDIETFRSAVSVFGAKLSVTLKEVSIAMGCVVLCFTVFQLISRRFHKHQLGRIAVGFIYTLIGLVFFLTGVNAGFSPVALVIGSKLAASSINWILIPIGAVIGYFLVAAEPDVYILNKQVEEISEGSITGKMMYKGLAVGMAAAIALTMTRILFGIPLLWILIPGFIFALALTFFVPKIFSGIAFDSGAVCSGPISVTFLLPLALGVAEGSNMDAMLYGIGVIAIIAMTPTIVIQIMGLIYQAKTKEAALLTNAEVAAISAVDTGEIIDWGDITIYKRGSNG